MSHAASHYVKHLVTAPNGERITAPEKAVLYQLADDHREEIGVAWPSVGSLALRACLSERQCRRVLASIERKGVILRLPTARQKDGGQSSNEYLFAQLDPTSRMDPKTLDENRRKLQNTPRSRMTGGGGHVRPTPPVTGDLPPRTSATGAPGHLRPPIDSSRESSQELSAIPAQEPNHPLPPPQADGVEKPPRRASVEDLWTGVCRDLDRHLLSTRPANGVAASGPDDWRACRFGQLAVVSAQIEGDGEDARRVLYVSSPDPPATERGLAKYRPTWDRLLEKWYKARVEIRVVGQGKAQGRARIA